MTVKEMMETLIKLDPNGYITIWEGRPACADSEYVSTRYVNGVEVDDDGDVVLY